MPASAPTTREGRAVSTIEGSSQGIQTLPGLSTRRRARARAVVDIDPPQTRAQPQEAELWEAAEPRRHPWLRPEEQALRLPQLVEARLRRRAEAVSTREVLPST
jgi:hypothetical protein